MSGGLRPLIMKFSFQNPFPVTENNIVGPTLCSNSTGGYVLGFRPALPLTWGSDTGGYVRRVYVVENFTALYCAHLLSCHRPYRTALYGQRYTEMLRSRKLQCWTVVG